MASYLVSVVVDTPDPGYILPNAMHTAFHKKSDRNIHIEKILLHPGEVNTIKPWPKDPRILSTHSDNSSVFIWNMQLSESLVEKKDTQANLPLLM
jgi:WD40 repeat protein